MAANVSQKSVMRAVLFDPWATGKFVLRPVPRPEPGPGLPLIRVAAFWLNRGEVRNALAEARDGARLGWDIAGTIERSATDGGSPPAGTRVVALDFRHRLGRVQRGAEHHGGAPSARRQL